MEYDSRSFFLVRTFMNTLASKLASPTMYTSKLAEAHSAENCTGESQEKAAEQKAERDGSCTVQTKERVSHCKIRMSSSSSGSSATMPNPIQIPKQACRPSTPLNDLLHHLRTTATLLTTTTLTVDFLSQLRLALRTTSRHVVVVVDVV